jgi:hypothetical protein
VLAPDCEHRISQHRVKTPWTVKLDATSAIAPAHLLLQMLAEKQSPSYARPARKTRRPFHCNRGRVRQICGVQNDAAWSPDLTDGKFGTLMAGGMSEYQCGVTDDYRGANQALRRHAIVEPLMIFRSFPSACSSASLNAIAPSSDSPA